MAAHARDVNIFIWTSRKSVDYETNGRVMVHGDGTRADGRRSEPGAQISEIVGSGVGLTEERIKPAPAWAVYCMLAIWYGAALVLNGTFRSALVQDLGAGPKIHASLCVPRFLHRPAPAWAVYGMLVVWYGAALVLNGTFRSALVQDLGARGAKEAIAAEARMKMGL